MIKMYTSLGRFEMRRNENGSQYPVVMLHGKEHILDIRDMIVWSTLMWAIHTEDELQEICGVKAHEANLPGISCVDCLTRLEERGLVVSGCDYVGLDSLYNLIENLSIVPVDAGIGTKILAFLHLTFIKGVPFRQTKKIFVADNLTNDEKAVLAITRRSVFTSVELIQYFQGNRFPVNSNEITNTENTSGNTVYNSSDYAARLRIEHRGVLQAVVNLYLKKLILFDKAWGGAE